ncbi:dienelactone hydrolase family protein [Candidatus Binatia bacterium]|nr:dienelactone hydrolase family protein [Candidatus Binatia bacterium]
MGEMVEVKRPDGKICPAYLVEPKAGAAAPGFVMIQEWWGLNDQIKGMAERLAGEGYRVLVPDLYRGEKATTPDEAGALMGALDFADAGKQDVRGCVQHLKKTSAKVAVGGFCLGGAVTVIAAVHVPEADAAVCFYGIPPATVADPSQVKAPFQGHFANVDDWCTPAAVDGLEAALARSGASFEIHRYQAQHAFMNEARPDVHDAGSAALAWQRAKDFLDRTLR